MTHHREQLRRHPGDTPRRALKAAVALLLTVAAGTVDIVGYLALYRTFTAHMTGTTVHLGNALVVHRWPEAIISGSVVVAFVLGSVVGRVIVEIGVRTRMRSIVAVTLGLEAALLSAFLAGYQPPPAGGVAPTATAVALLALLAAAMGLQTATLTRVGPLTVHTTFVTGMLNRLAQVISHALHSTWDLLHAHPDEHVRHRTRRRSASYEATFLLAIWTAYLCGAAAGTLLERAWGSRALLIAVAILVVAIAVDLWRPLPIEEEP